MGIKQTIVDEYLLGAASYRQLAKKYGYSRTAIHEWVQEFTGVTPIKRGTENVSILAAMAPEQTDSIKKEVEELQKQLAQEKLHTKLLTAMIEIAETELKIPIRKKYGTKQSKK